MSKMLGKVFLLAVVSLFIFSSGVFAAPVSLQMAEEVALTLLRANNERERLAALTTRKVFEKRSISMPDIIELRDDQTGEPFAYVLGLNPKGFIVVSPDTDITPVIAYSFKGNFPLEDFQDNVLLHMVTWDMENRLEAIPILPDDLKEKNNDLWEKYLSAENSFLDTQVRATQYGPYLTTYWKQGSPYNTSCPKDPVTGSTSRVGCVATAMAQIVNYHKYPSSVTFTSADDYTPETWSIPITATDANIPSITYSDTYLPSDGTPAKLSFACGVSVHMNYSSGGSGATTSDVATALKSKFGYASATAVAPYTDVPVPYVADFYSRLQDNMKNKQPAQLSIFADQPVSGTPVGHSIVCDGYYNLSPGYYHLNYGWGKNNPPDSTYDWWYSLPAWIYTNPIGERGNILIYAVLDIKPPASAGATYNGYILDCLTGGGISGAKVTVGGKTWYSDGNGFVSLTNIPSGSQPVEASKNGYTSLIAQITFPSSGTYNFGSACLQPTGATYYGYILDCVTGRAISGATVTIGGKSWYSDGNGFVNMTDMPSGSQPIEISKSGYKSITGYITVPSSGTYNFDWVCLQPTATTGNLTLLVTNWDGTRLLSGATVTVAGKSVTTGYDGYVTITGIAAGTNLVTVSYWGDSDYGYADIVAGTTVSYYFSLWWVY